MTRQPLRSLFTPRILIVALITLTALSLTSAQTAIHVAPVGPPSQQRPGPTAKEVYASLHRSSQAVSQNRQPAQVVADSAPLYDDFSAKWLNRTKWDPLTPNCWGNVLECVRQIRNGKLYLAVRNFGDTNSDTNLNWSESEVFFQNQSSVLSISADVTLLSYSGLGCSTNSDDLTHTQVMMGGPFFNSGSGDAFDDVTGLLILWVDTLNPTTIMVGGWWGWEDQGYWNYIASYPVGTPLTGSITWDKANHQFVATVKAADGTGGSVAMPYSLSDTTPPVNTIKNLDVTAHTLNCTTAHTFGQVEATYDNVRINQ